MKREDLDFLRAYAETRRFQNGHPNQFRWTPEGQVLFFLRSEARSASQSLFAFDLQSGTERPIASPESLIREQNEEISPEEQARRERMRLSQKGIVHYDISQDGEKVLVLLSGRLFVARWKESPIAFRELGEGKEAAIDPRFSPDGRWVAFVRDRDLWVVEVESGKEKRLTQSTSPALSHGLAEFVAQEEMGRMEGYWWSPDSRFLLVEEVDESPCERFHIADPSKPEAPPLAFAYPRAGRENAKVRLAIVPLEGGLEKARWLEWDREAFPYLVGVRWTQSRILLLLQDRLQQREILLAVDPSSLEKKVLLEERDPAWVRIESGMPHPIKGERFLWVSDREGEARLELRGEGGELIKVLTPPGFGFSRLIGVDDERKRVIVRASRDTAQAHIWSIPMEGGDPQPLSTEEGVHDAVLAPNASHLVHIAKLPNAPHRFSIRKRDGEVLFTLKSVAESPPFEPRLEFTHLGAMPYRALIIRPRDFDPGKRYPVLVDVYGGPGHIHVTMERDRWLLAQFFADHGFVVLAFDGRGTPGRGREWERAIRGDFSTIPLEDQVAAIEEALKRYPELDRNRIGIYGWSFGGYLSAMALLRRPDLFRAALAGAPVVDWRDYDTHYTERYLGLPEPEGEEGPYHRSSLLSHIHPISDKFPPRPLLIIHGTADDNVYFFHGLKLAHALFQKGRPFEFIPLLGQTHVVRDPEWVIPLEMKALEFFLRHLGAPIE
ncbi:MAG: alpha/beta fold hydrolase [Sandaracinaceae bacterium]|nr:alpha/beta fold hydrolase [Sandaracinaceae bacterium]